MYLILLAYILFLSFFSRVQPSYRNVIGSLIILILIVIAGFRYDVGMDYAAYDAIFNQIKRGMAPDTEIGFALICRACIALGGTSQLMFLIVAVITILLLYKTYKHFSPDIILTLAIFLCFGQMYMNIFNAIRQCLAIAIFVHAIQYIQQRDFRKYALSICLAVLFHKSAVLLFPLYWILVRKWSKPFLLCVLAGAILSSKIIINIINASPYAIYLRFDNFAKSAGIINYMYLLISSLIFVFSDRVMKRYDDRQIFLNINFALLLLFSIYVLFSGTPLVMVVSRLTYYFIFFYAIIFTRILSDIRHPALNLYIRLGAYAFLIMMYLRTTMLMGAGYHISPYQFNFNLFEGCL